MSKNTRIIILVVVALLTVCPGCFCCIFSIATLAGQGTFTLGEEVTELAPLWGLPIGLGALILFAIPVAVYFLLVRGKGERVVLP